MGQISSPAVDSKDSDLELPSSLSVLAIDSDLTVLEFIKKACNQYGNQVIACSESLNAVNVLRERRELIDLVLIEVHMPMMDGFEFQRFVNEEHINVPVIMMSWDASRPSQMRSIKLGACDYWIKPLHKDWLKTMWTHVIRKYVSENKTKKNIGSLEDDNKIRGTGDNSEFASSNVDLSDSNREDDDVDESKNSDGPSAKKTRVVWSPELHLAFLEAIDQIGIENAVPTKILEAMNIPGLERGHVASHLQKYRKNLTQRQQQCEMSSVLGKTEPRMPSGRILLQPLSATTEQALAHDHLTTFPNIVITENFPQSMGTLDDAYIDYVLFDTVLVDNPTVLQQSWMHRHHIHPMNFQSSSLIISRNPIGMNMNHGLISSQSVRGGNMGKVILNQYTTRASIYHPQLQNTGLPSDAVRSFAVSDSSSQNLSTDTDDKQPTSS